MDESFIPYRKAAACLREKLIDADMPLPEVGVICGSGLSGLSDTLEGKILKVRYGDIAGFPNHCTVAGHKGEVVFGMLSGVPTICFRGRFHSYEGHSMKTTVLPVHVMRGLGVKVVCITNAAGGLNGSYNVGDIVCVTDHFSLPQLAGKNALVGPNDAELGPRFPPTSNAYPPFMRNAATQAAKVLGLDFFRSTGTYCFVSGPMYESPAECRFLQSAGGDVVGMSTVPEIIAAHHCGIKVLCLSLVTNIVVAKTDSKESANHEEVLETVNNRSVQMQSLVKETVAQIAKTVLPDLEDLPPITLETPVVDSEKYLLPALLVGAAAVVAGTSMMLLKCKK